MKKLALSLFGLASLAAISVSAANYTPAQSEPQYQEQTEVPCYPDTCTNQLPCNQPVPCNPDTVCNPAPCYPAPGCGGC